MKKSRHSEEKVIAAVKQMEGGRKTADVVRELGVSAATLYVWKGKYGGMQVSEAKRLQQLEDENRRLKHLVADLSLPLALSELAVAVDLSPFYAARMFSRTIGLAPHAWRNQIRLNRAQTALHQGQSVTDVAALLGFADQSHFTRHFKRAFGIAPGRWRL